MHSEIDALAFGDIVLVPFPFTDQTATKRRPATVVSAKAYNARRPDIILMPVTSQLRAQTRPDDAVIDEWKHAGLLKPSAIKPVLATLDQALILRRLGGLGYQDRQRLQSLLQEILGLA